MRKPGYCFPFLLFNFVRMASKFPPNPQNPENRGLHLFCLYPRFLINPKNPENRGFISEQQNKSRP